MVRWALLVGFSIGIEGCDRAPSGVRELPDVPVPCTSWPEPGVYRVTVPGHTRRPWISVPDDLGRRDGLIMLHGAAGSGQKMLSTSTMRSHAARRGMVAVFPDGSGDAKRYYGYTWNAGGCCGWAKKRETDDLAFLTALANTVRERMCLDKILVAGHSNGAMMALRWSCEGTGIDAVFGVSGSVVVEQCDAPPIPTLVWHGTADPVVPFRGGPFLLGDELPDVMDAFGKVRHRNQCADASPFVATDGDVTCETWRCAQPTTFCSIDGWGHEWPGGRGVREGGPSAEEVGLGWFDAWRQGAYLTQ